MLSPCPTASAAAASFGSWPTVSRAQLARGCAKSERTDTSRSFWAFSAAAALGAASSGICQIRRRGVARKASSGPLGSQDEGRTGRRQLLGVVGVGASVVSQVANAARNGLPSPNENNANPAAAGEENGVQAAARRQELGLKPVMSPAMNGEENKASVAVRSLWGGGLSPGGVEKWMSAFAPKASYEDLDFREAASNKMQVKAYLVRRSKQFGNLGGPERADPYAAGMNPYIVKLDRVFTAGPNACSFTYYEAEYQDDQSRVTYRIGVGLVRVNDDGLIVQARDAGESIFRMDRRFADSLTGFRMNGFNKESLRPADGGVDVFQKLLEKPQLGAAAQAAASLCGYAVDKPARFADNAVLEVLTKPLVGPEQIEGHLAKLRAARDPSRVLLKDYLEEPGGKAAFVSYLLKKSGGSGSIYCEFDDKGLVTYARHIVKSATMRVMSNSQ